MIVQAYWEMFAELLRGAAMTLAVSSVGIALGTPFGGILAIVRVSRIRILSRAVAVYVSVIRSTPVVTLALLIFFGMPTLGLVISPIISAVLTLSINTSAFNAEIFRAAIIDFPENQSEAARAFGMSQLQIFRLIVLPQVWRASLPAMVNEMTFLIKSSPVIAVIGVVDLTRTASRIAAETYNPLPPYISAAIIYAIAVLCLVRTQRFTERLIISKYGIL